jgi:hypothetical protein
VVSLSKTGSQVSDNLTPHDAAPALVTNPGLYSYTRIHVCQASYGDCLAIEHDPNPPEPKQSVFPRLAKAEHAKELLKVCRHWIEHWLRCV